MYLPKRTTWFMTADGARMRLYKSMGVGEPLELIEERGNGAPRAPAHELGRDRPTRGQKIGSGERYAVDAPSEHDKAEDAFVRAQADFINKAALAGDFDQLVIAAPPRALGALRKRLAPDVTARFIGVFDKNLLNFTKEELLDYFKERLVRW